MSTPLFTGDDWDISVTLKTDGVATNVSGATAIKAAVVTNNADNPTALIAAVTASAGATGADWANGVVVIEFPAASTGIATGEHLVEVQVEESSKKKTWPRIPITVKAGVIA